jgi:hypothetical protein
MRAHDPLSLNLCAIPQFLAAVFALEMVGWFSFLRSTPPQDESHNQQPHRPRYNEKREHFGVLHLGCGQDACTDW